MRIYAMIIIVGDTQLNQQAANALEPSAEIQIYPKLNLSQCKDKTITILDLRANAEFQEMLSPTLFAQNLIDSGLSKEVKTFHFVVSDMYHKKTMLPFAQNFCNDLNEKGITVNVYLPIDINYQTFIQPPTSVNNKWQIYGISLTDYLNDFESLTFDATTFFSPKGVRKPAYELNLEKLNEYKHKQLLWEGDNLFAWMTLDTDKLVNPRKLEDYTFKFA